MGNGVGLALWLHPATAGLLNGSDAGLLSVFLSGSSEGPLLLRSRLLPLSHSPRRPVPQNVQSLGLENCSLSLFCFSTGVSVCLDVLVSES